MTIEKEAEKRYPTVDSELVELHDYNNAAREGFIEGAYWAKCAVLLETIQWLQDNIEDYLFSDGTPEKPWLRCDCTMYDNLREAMKTIL